MKCYKCGKRDLEIASQLTEYGVTRVGGKPTPKYTSDYCVECFEIAFPQLHDRTENEEEM